MTDDTPAGERILLVQPLPGIGDMVWFLPHLHAIAATTRRGRVSILTKPRSFADKLLTADPSVDEILWLRRNPGEHDGLGGFLRLARQLRAGHYDQVWILHISPRYAMAAWLAGIPVRIGYGIGWQRLFVNRSVRLPVSYRRAHATEKATQLLRLRGLQDIEAEPRLCIAPEADAAVAARFADRPTPWLALGVGGSGAFKQWGPDNFARLIGQFLAGEPVTSVFLVGGPAEREIVDAILARLDVPARERVTPAIDLPLEQTVALLGRCRLFVGNDTGVLNVAAATGVDAIGLFGSTPPLRHARHIHPVLPDAGASSQQGRNNMAGISVAAVLDRALALWHHAGA